MKSSKRIKYNKSPLIEVVLQLRFPTILSIGAGEPVNFQDKIRENFPFYQEGIQQQNELVVSSDGIPTQLKRSQLKIYNFFSKDKLNKISFTPSYINISTKNYIQWECFFQNVSTIIKIFQEEYKPSFYTRVGLKYIDLIKRSKYGLENKKWGELIKPHILGIVIPELEDGVRAYSTKAEFKNLKDNSFTKEQIEFVRVNNDTEVSLLIDCEYFTTELVKVDDLDNTMNLLHCNAKNFIDSVITKELSKAMEPVEI